ncbi:hypothetical protein O6H91_01G003700 [Diphasiastrum complanatum]|uniref:Uncharacterized protein n=1 Tax=Diphasiastrum complanatum TaxID=34168 RepID=A0ACC2EMS2_DIPCM|nr:hypothetical protein O6H91_01G003700 [Diphasiastrum complanatum]
MELEGIGNGMMMAPTLARMTSKDLDRARQQQAAGSTSRRRGAGDGRFAANSFQYNTRVAIALVPCVALVLGMSEKPSLAVLTVGLMVSYILDALQMKHGAFFGIWATLAATIVSLALTGQGISGFMSWPLNVLSYGVLLELMFLVGVWASLQFRWLQLENPSVVVALERLLFACMLFAAGSIQTWGVISAIGLEHASFYCMAIQFVLYWLFSLPQTSSFRGKTEKNYGGQISEDAMIMGPLEGCFHTLVLLYLPLFIHVGSHHARLFSSVDLVCELLLLFFIPLLFLLFASTRGALWWLVKDQNQLHNVRVVNGAIALLIILLCLEVRVIFHSLGHYIRVRPPWNHILVTVTLVGVVAAKLAYDMGLIKDRAKSYLLTILLMLIFLSASLAIGLPLKLSFAPAISAFYLSRFFTKKSLTAYFIAIISASVPVIWFILRNFWSLKLWIGGVPLQVMCKLIISSTLLAMLIPGLMLLPRKAHFLVEIGFIAQALLICTLENKLYIASSYYFGFEDETVYPSYMLMLTAATGVLLVRRMIAEKRISSISAWILNCLYLAKLSMLFISSRSVLWDSVILLLSISPPVFFYREKAKGGSKMKAWQGLLHTAVSIIAVWLCRSTIFEVLQWITGRSPSYGLLLGSFILMSGVAVLPVVSYHFSHIQLLKRILVVVLGTGMLLIFMQPSVPRSWNFSWDSVHVPNNLDDEAIYGTKLSRPVWPTWLLLVMFTTSLGVLTSAIPIQRSTELRLLYAIGLGAGAGIYVCTEFFSEAPAIHDLILIASILAVVFLVFLHLPSTSSPRILPWVFVLFVALLPVIYLIEGNLRTRSSGQLLSEEGLAALLAIEGGRTSLLGLYAAVFMLVALEVKFKLTSLVGNDAFDKNRDKASHRTGFPSRKQSIQRPLPSVIQSFTIKKLGAEGTWIPAFGNVATVLCFGLCVLLNVHVNGGSDRAIFFLAPILLLLNQDSNLIMGFGDRQRYFPVTAVISLYLMLSSAYKVWQEVRHGYQNAGWGLEMGGPGLFYALKNALLLLVTIPNHILFNRFMWNYVRQKDFLLLLTTPLNLPSIVATDQSTIRALGLLGIAFALVQYIVSRRIRLAGMKYI